MWKTGNLKWNYQCYIFRQFHINWFKKSLLRWLSFKQAKKSFFKVLNKLLQNEEGGYCRGNTRKPLLNKLTSCLLSLDLSLDGSWLFNAIKTQLNAIASIINQSKYCTQYYEKWLFNETYYYKEQLKGKYFLLSYPFAFCTGNFIHLDWSFSKIIWKSDLSLKKKKQIPC